MVCVLDRSRCSLAVSRLLEVTWRLDVFHKTERVMICEDTLNSYSSIVLRYMVELFSLGLTLSMQMEILLLHWIEL